MEGNPNCSCVLIAGAGAAAEEEDGDDDNGAADAEENTDPRSEGAHGFKTDARALGDALPMSSPVAVSEESSCGLRCGVESAVGRRRAADGSRERSLAQMEFCVQ